MSAGAEVIYVCLNTDCSFPWRPSPGPCSTCAQELAPAIAVPRSGVIEGKLVQAVERNAPKLGDVATDCREAGHPKIADAVEAVLADFQRAKDGMP